MATNDPAAVVQPQEDIAVPDPTFSVDELMSMNPISHSTTSAESTAAEDIEDQLLQMASSPRGEALVSPRSGNVPKEKTEAAPASVTVDWSLPAKDQAGESVSAMSALSAVDDSGHHRRAEPSGANIVDHGPPTNIIQQPPNAEDDADSSFIKLESMKDEGSERMSEVSDFNMPPGNGNNNDLLNMASSSDGTSMGSQGSYAHQVPALSQSTSASNGGSQHKTQQGRGDATTRPLQIPPRREVDLTRGGVVLPPRSGEGLMIMDPSVVSGHSAGTPMPHDVGTVPHNSDLDDILGPNGAPMQSDLDEILGPHDGQPSNLDDTLGPYDAEASKAPEPIPSSDSAIGEGLNYASMYTKQLPDTTGASQLSHFRGSSLSRKSDTYSSSEPSPNITPTGSEPGTPTNNTPVLSRRAIDHIGRALAERDAKQNPISPNAGTGASILPEPTGMGGGSTAFESAMDYHTPRQTAGVTSPQSSVSSFQNRQGQDFFPQKAETVDSVEPASTWESRNNTLATSVSHAATSHDEGDETSRGGATSCPDNQSSYWASSRGDTMSVALSSRDETLSPSSRGEHAMSPSTRATTVFSSHDGSFDSSHRGTFSPRDDSTRGESEISHAASSRSGARSPGYSSQGDGLSPTEHTRDYSLAEHTRTGDSVSQVESYVRGDHYSQDASEYSQDSARQFTFDSDQGSQSSPTKRSRVHDFSHTTSEESDFTGTERDTDGVLSTEDSAVVPTIKDGSERAAPFDEPAHRPLSPQAQKFAESIMARTRSRADPDALMDNASTMGGDVMETPTRSMVKLTTDEDVSIIESTALARKRVRVVQLLGAGLTTFLVSFMGGFWIQSSCHFVSTKVEVGENAEEFSLRFGLWKYSPIDSVFQGYSYCSHYDDEYVDVGPWFGRLTSNLALIGGAFSLVVLWIYLVFGRCNHRLWKGALLAAGLSGILQLMTLFIFIGPVCSNGCTLGPGGYVSVLAGCFYLFLAYEMFYNAPLATVADGLLTTPPSGEQPQNLMASLQMRDFKHGAKAYVRRLTLGDANPYPTLNEALKKSGSPMGESMMGRDLSKSSSYQPPPVLV